MVLAEAELRGLALQPADIIWPQVLEDHQTTGQTSYYVSIDRVGQVHEVLPLEVAVERADDSARRQLMKWKFKPVLRDGVPVQAEAVLSFNFNMRAYGPSSPLTDAEGRKLATGIADPKFPPGSKTGSICNIRIAVDADGRVIEQIAVDGSSELTMPCMGAIGKWQFNPILENGEPRPYRRGSYLPRSITPIKLQIVSSTFVYLLGEKRPLKQGYFPQSHSRLCNAHRMYQRLAAIFLGFIHSVPAGTFSATEADGCRPHPLQSWIKPAGVPHTVGSF